MVGDKFQGRERAEMQRHEMWRQCYRENRYAQHLTRVEFNKRFRDIFLNLTKLTQEGKIGLLPMTDSGIAWMEKWTHVLEELCLRYGPWPNGMDRSVLHSEPFPNFVSELGLKAAATMASRGLTPGNVFIKLGRPEHMESLHQRGQLRIQPASYFSNPAHNGAVRDDELSIAISVALDRRLIKRLVKNPNDVPDKIPSQRMDIELTSPTDYWLYCVTTSIEPRLFVDFNTSACVIIRDPAEFQRRLEAVASIRLSDARFSTGDAVYVDPLLPETHKIFVPLAKPFGYTYQQEFRFVWVPRTNASSLNYVDVEIGDLSDISDLVVI